MVTKTRKNNRKSKSDRRPKLRQPFLSLLIEEVRCIFLLDMYLVRVDENHTSICIVENKQLDYSLKPADPFLSLC